MATADVESDFGTEPQPQGKGCGKKAVIIIGIMFAILALVCCGGLGYIIYVVRPTITEDPSEVVAKTAEIADIAILDGLEPKAAESMIIPFANIELTEVEYSDETGQDFVFMFVASVQNLDDIQMEEFHRILTQATSEHKRKVPEILNVSQSRDEIITVGGEPAALTISHGTGQRSNRPRLEVTGVFEGKIGTSKLIVNVDAEKYSEEDVLKMLSPTE